MQDVLKKLDKFLEDLFVKKAPALPKGGKEWLVKALPWLMLIFGLMALPNLFSVLGFGMAGVPFWMMGKYTSRVFTGFLFSLTQTALSLLAVSFLFKKAKKGWQLLFWAMLVGIINTLFYFSPGGLLMMAVSLYFLYQIKSYYKK